MFNLEKERFLGRGSYSTVHRIRDINGKKYAGKFVNCVKFKKSLFQREIDILKSLDHPNIVKFCGIAETEIIPEANADGLILNCTKTLHMVLITEYCNKSDLCVKYKNVCSSVEVVMKFFRQACEAVKYLHQRNIVHLDIKLNNLFLDSKHNVKLGDFGFARELEEDQYLSENQGTPSYSAPEIILRNSYRFEPDIWSLGVCLYVMTYKIFPFDNQTVDKTFEKIVNLDYVIPKESNLKSASVESLLKRIFVYRLDRIDIYAIDGFLATAHLLQMESRWRIIYITCGREVNGTAMNGISTNKDGWTDTEDKAFEFFETCVKMNSDSVVRLDKLVGSTWHMVKQAGNDRYGRLFEKQ